ncbi:MAG: D-2-hydroxyacid dehydrogenase [Thermoplasmatota archaeon]
MDGKIRILIGRDLPDDLLGMITDVDPGIEIDISRDSDERDRKVGEADILFTHRPKIDMRNAPNLKWIHFMWEGVDHILEGDDVFPGVILTNSSGAHSIPIAEHVFTCILNFSRKFPMYMEYQERHEWLDWWDQPRTESLNGKTIGIVGYGRIGRAVAKIAQGFGMKVIALKRDPDRSKNEGFDTPGCCDMKGLIPDTIYGPEGLSELLSESDFVVLCLPLTGETFHIIGSDELKMMKRSSYLVNIGRGDLVNEKALIEALKEGVIAGAGLDVFSEEPLPPESEIWDLENVMVTPHSSTGGDWADEAVCRLFVENLRRYIEGREMLNVVDKRRGY